MDERHAPDSEHAHARVCAARSARAPPGALCPTASPLRRTGGWSRAALANPPPFASVVVLSARVAMCYFADALCCRCRRLGAHRAWECGRVAWGRGGISVLVSLACLASSCGLGCSSQPYRGHATSRQCAAGCTVSETRKSALVPVSVNVQAPHSPCSSRLCCSSRANAQWKSTTGRRAHAAPITTRTRRPTAPGAPSCSA